MDADARKKMVEKLKRDGMYEFLTDEQKKELLGEEPKEKDYSEIPSFFDFLRDQGSITEEQYIRLNNRLNNRYENEYNHEPIRNQQPIVHNKPEKVPTYYNHYNMFKLKNELMKFVHYCIKVMVFCILFFIFIYTFARVIIVPLRRDVEVHNEAQRQEQVIPSENQEFDDFGR